MQALQNSVDCSIRLWASRVPSVVCLLQRICSEGDIFLKIIGPWFNCWLQKVKEKGFDFQHFGFEVCAEKNNVKICDIKRNIRSNKEWRLLQLHIRT